MLAHEMHGGHIKSVAACRTASCCEDGRCCGKLGEFGLGSGGVGTECRNDTAVLDRQSMSVNIF